MNFIDKLKSLVSTKPKIKMVKTNRAITLQIPDRRDIFIMANTHTYFERLEVAARNNDIEKVKEIIDLAEKIQTYVQGNITITNGVVRYKNEIVKGILVDKIIKAMEKGLPSKPLILFLENLMQNPSRAARDELYDFMQKTNLPVTNDGRFVAYKWVRSDYTDCHTGKTKHNLGDYVSMPREKVNSDRNETCASGLHVCGSQYTKFGEKLLLVLVNPKDVVSVPVDYNSNKMRVCAYQVFKEILKTERYGKDEIVEANAIFFTKIREPEVEVKPEVKVETTVETPVEVKPEINMVTPSPVILASKEECSAVTINNLSKKSNKIKVPVKLKDGKKPRIPEPVTPVAKALDKKTVNIFKDIKNKRGKALICQRYSLTEQQYQKLLLKYKAHNAGKGTK